ncbi:MAG: FliM/FliN family flagellar motor C-terminal domain-containing protein [Cypionkella sp.]|nr:FliM/FliN family flagellar motor C-terminal domain-containing protein [Cypionkella sp.]
MADGQLLASHVGVLARKLARARGAGCGLGAEFPVPTDGSQSADFAAPPPAADPHLRAWRLALARAARDQLKLAVGFQDIHQTQASLTEILETPMERALILMLQGAGDGMGLMIISGQMLAAMVEILTLTHLSHDAPDAGDLRKPTRTDAAMAVEFVDAALSGLETIVAETLGAVGVGNDGADWAAGYRYAAFIDDPRPLHLMLEDGEYTLFSAELMLEDGARHGHIWLALPMAAPAQPVFDPPPLDANDAAAAPAQGDTFTQDLANHVQGLPANLDACLAQISLPLERILRLQVGEVLALPLASLDQIDVKGIDGQRMGRARLGQNRGMRALRLTDTTFAQLRTPQGAVAAAQGHGTAVTQMQQGGASHQGAAMSFAPPFAAQTLAAPMSDGPTQPPGVQADHDIQIPALSSAMGG